MNLPVLHGDPWALSGPFWTSWTIPPPVVVGLFALAAGYLYLTGRVGRPVDPARRATNGQVTAFLAGVVVLGLAFGPPLEDWTGLLLAAHMVQHLLLTLLVAPLFLIGTPGWLFDPLVRRPVIRQIGYWLTRPVPALAIPALVFGIWHFPALYEASLRSEPVHIMQHVMLLTSAVLGWWPVLGRVAAWPALRAPLTCLYLFAQTLPSGMTGAFITFAAPGLYTPYTTVPRMWGIDLAMDQELGGVLMWVGGSSIYLLLVTILFFQWAGREEAAAR